jgi:hypothetical protein
MCLIASYHIYPFIAINSERDAPELPTSNSDSASGKYGVGGFLFLLKTFLSSLHSTQGWSGFEARTPACDMIDSRVVTSQNCLSFQTVAHASNLLNWRPLRSNLDPLSPNLTNLT